MNFMKPGVFYLQKLMNFMKMRTFYKKKLPLFYKKKLNFAYLQKTQTSNMSFIKNSIFGINRDPWGGTKSVPEFGRWTHEKSAQPYTNYPRSSRITPNSPQINTAYGEKFGPA